MSDPYPHAAESDPIVQPPPPHAMPSPAGQPPASYSAPSSAPPAAPLATYGVPMMPVAPVQFVQVQPKGLSITAMVLGLVSIVGGFTVILPLGALIFGLVGLKKEPAGRGFAIVGVVVGGLTALFWLSLGGAILAGIGAMLAGTASAGY
ncbi:DUF4190 domain-containing protein [Microbacteriaceae bacterium VKM Ac-2854]|nr:DUF4190 domain-containing protein [Microbacteriaceae bacterium VKM Ac-2854]